MGDDLNLDDILNANEDVNLANVISIDSNFKNIVLSDEHPTVLYIPCGKQPRGRAEQYLKAIQDRIKTFGDQYKVLLIAVFDS